MQYFGIFLGEVEYINDPAQMGRVKVRVPTLDDTHENCPTDGLPWALPCMPYSGGDSFGSMMVPPEGSSVWVMFQNGDPNYRVYMGGFPGMRFGEKTFLRNASGTLPEGPVSMSPDKGTTWIAAPGPEAPEEYLIQNNLRPERVIPVKTVKGATIDINDADEEESLSILDRSGQELSFESFVSAKENEKNAAARGLHSAVRGNALDLSKTLVEGTKVILKDLNGQFIALQSNKNDNRILLVSKNTKQTETEGSSEIRMELLSDQNKLEISLFKEGKKKASFTLDGNTGFAEIVSPSLVKIDSDNILLNGHVSINGKLSITDDLVVLGNSILTNLIDSTTNIKVSSSLEEPSI